MPKDLTDSARSVRVTHFRIIGKPIRYFMSLYTNTGLIFKGSKDIVTKIIQNHVFGHPTVI